MPQITIINPYPDDKIHHIAKTDPKLYEALTDRRKVEVGGGAGAGAEPKPSGFSLLDDFIGGTYEPGEIGDLGWDRVGGKSQHVTELGDPGSVQVYIPTDSFGLEFDPVDGIFSPLNPGMIDAAEEFISLFRIKIDLLNGATMMRIGFSGDKYNPIADPPDDGIYIEKLFGDSNWNGVSRGGGAQTRITNIAPLVTGTFLNFWIIRLSTAVGFRVAGNGRFTTSGNIPATGLYPWIFFAATDTTDRWYRISQWGIKFTNINISYEENV